ncbi:MAG: branched-chain amino acid abc transporter, amino acid-binding protein [Ramlibacter sp.]|nr:branched-chain amino acid abc transporter, amino acid-binding protein [Ramlibacter sp.]
MNPSKRKLLAIGAVVAAGLLAGGAAVAQAKPPVKLGLITPMTGPLGASGKIQEIVVKLAVEDINAKGGINGSLLQVDVSDASTDPGQAVLMFRKYAGEGHFGVIGPMTGTQWETVSPLANQINMPAISVNASKPGITVRPWTIRLEPPDDTLIPEGLRDFLKAYPKTKRVVIVADVREASSKAAADAYADLARKSGLEVVETVEFSSRATDLSAAAIQIKSHNPDAILAAAFPAQAMLLAKDLTAQGLKAPILNISVLWAGPFINMVGDLGRNWHVIGWSTNESGQAGTDNALYASIVKRVLPKGDAQIGNPPNLANWSLGYDAVLLYADIMRRNGIDGNTDPKTARELIKNEFVKLKTFAGAYKYTMLDTGDAHIPATVLIADVEKKQWKFLLPQAR